MYPFARSSEHSHFPSDYLFEFFAIVSFRVTFCSFIERRYIAKETKRVAPISEYPALTLCLLGSSALSNWSLNYINFPTKVVFRGCKLISTMFIATLI